MALQNLLVARATGGGATESDYQELRRALLNVPDVQEQIPDFLRQNRSLDHFWAFIKSKFSTYEERRRFIWEAFNPLLDRFESDSSAPPRPIGGVRPVRTSQEQTVEHLESPARLPRLFIASSVEGLDVAYTLQQSLEHDVEGTVWNQGVFELSKTSIESLVEGRVGL